MSDQTLLSYTQDMDKSDTTYSSLKNVASAMSRAYRDSRGGGIMERFENVSKLLFIALYESKHPGLTEDSPFEQVKGETDRAIYERGRSLWLAISELERDSLRGMSKFPDDVEATAKCIRLLRNSSLSTYTCDVRGSVYEELLRNTFEKDDNQQYFTPKIIVDFIVGLLDWREVRSVCDPACGSGSFLVSAVAAARMVSNKDFEVYGLDIDERMAWVARTNLLTHDANPSNIICLPGSGSLGKLGKIAKLLPDGHVDAILENPPFGSDISDEKVLKDFCCGKGRTSRRRSILFLERSIELLKPGGVLAIILDDSVLNLEGNADIRELVRNKASVLAVISLPEVTFMPYSTAKSSILLLKKGCKQGPVFMALAKEVGKRPNGDALLDDSGDVVSDLPEITNSWMGFCRGTDPQDNGTSFVSHLEEDKSSRLDVSYYHPSRFLATKQIEKAIWPIVKLEDLFDCQKGSLSPSKIEEGDTITWIGLADIEANTGIYRPKVISANAIRSQAHCYCEGDILFSRLRPELRKAVLVGEGDGPGYCSSELVVLKPKPDSAYDFSAKYIAIVLRSDVAYGQEVYRVTGLGRPRVGIAVLRNLCIPLPPLGVQEAAAKRYEEALERYRTVCRDAEKKKEEAMQGLERAHASIVS